MSGNAEEGIAKTQAAAAQAQGAAGLGRHHKGTIAYLDERILVFLIAIGLIGLLLLWTTVKSPLLLYGSLLAVILLTLLWGYARIRRIERVGRERAQKASDWQAQQRD